MGKRKAFNEKNWFKNDRCPYCGDRIYQDYPHHNINLKNGEIQCDYSCSDHEDCGGCFTVVYKLSDDGDYEKVSIKDSGGTW